MIKIHAPEIFCYCGLAWENGHYVKSCEGVLESTNLDHNVNLNLSYLHIAK